MVFFFFFSRETCGVFAPQPRVKPAPPALKGKGLTAGLPGKSLKIHFGLNYQKYSIHENGIKRKMWWFLNIRRIFILEMHLFKKWIESMVEWEGPWPRGQCARLPLGLMPRRCVHLEVKPQRKSLDVWNHAFLLQNSRRNIMKRGDGRRQQTCWEHSKSVLGQISLDSKNS